MRCIKSVVMPSGDTYTMGGIYRIHHTDDVAGYVSLFSDQNKVCIFFYTQFMNSFILDEYFESIVEIRGEKLDKLGI